jgi:dGTPase
MYRHPRVLRIMGEAEAVIGDLFERYVRAPGDLPCDVSANETARARQIADFIAGMTDRYALSEHARLFDSTPDLR